MAFVSLLGFDGFDVAATRKICFASSLRGFRPHLHCTKPKQEPRSRLSPFYASLRPGLCESSGVERWTVGDVPVEASFSLHRGVVRHSVATSTPFTPLRVAYGGGVWFGVGIGMLVALLVQFVTSRFRNRSRNRTLVRQARPIETSNGSSLPLGEDGETVEWVNMCWRKIWRVYQQGLEKWLAGVLQPVFDKVVNEGAVPRILKGIKIVELTFDHQAPYFTNLRRRTSRKDSDLNGVVDVRYTGGARMLLMLEVGGGRWLTKVPVLVSDLDLECQLWLKVRLAPLTPYLGTLSFAFVGPPNIKVQLAPYNSVRLMRIPVLQNFLTRLLTKVLPGYMVLPKRLEISIPPAITAVAEAAVGRDAVMKAVASAVLQADALEQSLLAVLPLGPQSAAGGITLPKSFQGELSVALIEGRDLPVWGFPWQSNPYCRLTLGKQAVLSKRENDTGTKGGHRRPIWNQEFEFLVENLGVQTLQVYIKDSPITGRPEVGKVEFPLSRLLKDGSLSIWLPVQQVNPGQDPMGELHLDLSYKPFVDEDFDSGYIEAENYARQMEDDAEEEITDIKSAAAASSKAAAAASAAFSAIAITRAAAARAAHRAQTAALAATKIASLGSGSIDDECDLEDEEVDFDPDTYDMDDMRMDEEAVSQNGFSDETDEHTLLTGDVSISANGVPTEPVGPQYNGSHETNGMMPATSDVRLNGAVPVPPPTAVEIETALYQREPSEENSQESIPATSRLETLLPETEAVESSADTAETSTRSESEDEGQEQPKPWWSDLIRRRPNGDSDVEEAAAEEEEETKSEGPQKKERIHWWMWLTSSIAFWRSRSQIISSASSKAKGKQRSRLRDSDRSVVVPEDLPLEEIAKEVVRLKTVTDKDEQERMNRIYTEAVERSDRKWIMLLCFLISLSIGMLSIVAMRIGPM